MDKLLEQWKREEIEPFSGWDFSHLDGRTWSDPMPWSYERIASALMAQSEAALDLGTGGGERLMAMRDVFPARVAATEGYEPNFLLAQERLGPLGVQVERAQDGMENPIPFGSEEFDLVICRHTAYNIAEVERILKPGGVFCTQQVSYPDLADLQEAFGTESQWPYWTLQYALGLLESTSLVVEVAWDWIGKTTFTDVGAVIYFLKAIPWIVEGFSVDTHLPYLRRLQERLEREGKLMFQTSRMILQVRKAG